MKKTWFITGASRGFGRIWAEAADYAQATSAGGPMLIRAMRESKFSIPNP